jgi:NDP-sugar pyrophosphorylase family protein
VDTLALHHLPCRRTQVGTVDVKAIILIGARPDGTPPEAAKAVSIGGVPAGLLDVLGEPLVQRMADRLMRQGVDQIAVISDTVSAAQRYVRQAQRPDLRWQSASGNELWRAAAHTFSEFAHAGADIVLVVRLGAYAEIDIDGLVQFHIDQSSRVTAACDELGPVGTFAISASRRNDAAFLFRHNLERSRMPMCDYVIAGYCNRLETAADLRRLTLDSLLQRTSIRPIGREIRPGVWVAPGARIHRAARVLAPAFIGARSRVRAAAVITRGSSVEHHTDIDCGTVVDNSTVLPFTYVGAGLDLAQAVVGMRRVLNLPRGVEVEITDPRFVGERPHRAPVRALASAASLASYLPTQFVRGLFSSKREQPMELPGAVSAVPTMLHPPPIKENDQREFSPKLFVARRYGNE